MKYQPTGSLKIASILGTFCLFVPASIIGIWVHSFNLGTTQMERVAIFHHYFPEVVRGRFTLTLISMAFCILSLILGRTGTKLPGKSWKALNSITLGLAVLILLMNLFEMM